MKVHVVEPEFEYVVKEHPQILNPDWKPRDKDIIAKQYLKEMLEARDVDLDMLYSFGYESSLYLIAIVLRL